MPTKTILATIAVAIALLCTLPSYAVLEISLDKSSGFYEQTFQLNIITSQPATVYYTMDGSDPAISGTRISQNPSGSILINQTTVIRVFATYGNETAKKSGSFIFLDQVLQQNNADVISNLDYPSVWGTGITNSIDPNSPPDNPQFITITQDADYEMDQIVVMDAAYNNQLIEGFKQIPTLSIATNKENLFGTAAGIYTHTFEDWTIPAAVEMINTDGTSAFCIEAGLSIAGNVSRKYDYFKNSLQLSFNTTIGDGELAYNLFGANGSQSFKSLKLRMIEHCSPHDWDYSRRHKTQFHKDQWTRELYREMGNISPHSKFVHVFLNGLYWGMYDLCEFPNADFIASYQSSNAQDYDVMNHLGTVNGDSIDYIQMFDRARDVEMDTIFNGWIEIVAPNQTSLNDMYDEISAKLDIDAFVDYFLLNSLLVNTDWGANNWYAAKQKQAGGLWQFFPWDAEFALNDSPVYTSRVYYGSDLYHPNELDKLLRRVDRYRKIFGDRVQCHCLEEDGTLYTDNLLSSYSHLENTIDKASLLELARWGDIRGTLIDYNTHVVGETTKYMNTIIPDLFDGDKGLLFYMRYGDDNYYPKFIFAPELSTLGGQVQAGHQLSLTNPNAVGDIYYTLDGSDPSEPNNPATQLYSAPITINVNTEVSARVFVDTFTYGIANKDTIFDHWSAMCPREFITNITEENYVSIEQVAGQNELYNVCINMFPAANPQDFILEFSDPITSMNGEVELEIFDFTGNALINARLDLGIQNFFTLSLNSGIYLYTLSIDQAEIFSGKIVKN